jgi:hypothetical protein
MNRLVAIDIVESSQQGNALHCWGSLVRLFDGLEFFSNRLLFQAVLVLGDSPLLVSLRRWGIHATHTNDMNVTRAERDVVARLGIPHGD